EVMEAICSSPLFRIAAPVYDQESVRRAASEFSDINKSNILTGCVGCVDGWLCAIKAPSSREVPDVSAFFSGHYLRHGINVQAMCDAACRFTDYCINSPGKVADSVAFKKWKLSLGIANLPLGYYVIGDNAYPLSSTVLVPFTKPEIKSTDYSDYSFYLSRLLRVAGLGYCVPVVPINQLTRTGPIRTHVDYGDYGKLFTPPMIRRVG
ncbi:hypothetical protein PHYSODRAFT_479486, partial [Phytophthora sojae]